MVLYILTFTHSFRHAYTNYFTVYEISGSYGVEFEDDSLLKRRSTSTLHGAISQKAANFSITEIHYLLPLRD
jgi:hypothetical protein